MNNYFFFGLDKLMCFILLFWILLVAVIVVVIVFVVVVVVAVVDKFDAYCWSRISKLSPISSSFKPIFLFFAGNIFESEDVGGSCSLTSDVELFESVGENMKM